MSHPEALRIPPSLCLHLCAGSAYIPEAVLFQSFHQMHRQLRHKRGPFFPELRVSHQGMPHGLCLDHRFVRNRIDHISGFSDHVMKAHMVFLPESFPHQSHHLNRTGSNAQSIYSIPGINGCVRCFSSYCDTLCGKSIAGCIPQIKVFFYRHHVYMCGHNNIRMIKFSKPDQLAFSGCRKTDSLFPEPCTFICINVFFRRNGKKIRTQTERLEPPHWSVPMLRRSWLQSVRGVRMHVLSR